MVGFGVDFPLAVTPVDQIVKQAAQGEFPSVIFNILIDIPD